MNKQEIYALLDERNIWHEVTEHKAVYNMAEVAEIYLPYPEADAKNIFIRDDKKRNYYLITVKGDKRTDLKAFRKQNGTRPLTFASDQDLMDSLGLIPGAVTPLGLLNDREHKVTFFLDKSFLEGSGLIGVHPNDNTATVWLKAQDLLKLLEENSTRFTLFDAGESGGICRLPGDPSKLDSPYTVLVNQTTQYRGILYEEEFDGIGVHPGPQRLHAGLGGRHHRRLQRHDRKAEEGARRGLRLHRPL